MLLLFLLLNATMQKSLMMYIICITVRKCDTNKSFRIPVYGIQRLKENLQSNNYWGIMPHVGEHFANDTGKLAS